MDQPMPNLMFNGMSFIFKVRDLVKPPQRLLDEVDFKMGDVVLDFGCGPGAFVPGTAQRVGAQGKVYALDIQPLALERVRRIATQQGLSQVHPLPATHPINLPDDSVDRVLLFDVFHMLGDQAGVLVDLHRLLKPAGTLAVTADHIGAQAMIAKVTEKRTFAWKKKGKYVHIFAPA